MNYYFTETQKNEIIEKWGSEFYSTILSHIGIYSQKWGLCDFEFAKFTSHNVIFFCKSELYGDCALKFYGETWEHNALREYNITEKFCKVFEFDLETRAMLIERIIPGKMLKDEPSLEKRLSVFSELFNGLHIEPKNPEIYISYLKLMCDVTEFMKTRKDNKELYAYVLKAKEMFVEMSSVYDKKALLHWDLNNENILSDKNGKYKIIDPMGVIGDPVLEVGRYISKECWDAASENRFETADKITEYFEANLKIPKKISKQCLYIDIIFLNCHWIERGGTACMDEVRFAEAVLSENN